MMQGRVAGDILGGKAAAFDSRAIPRIVFAEPEIAAAGLTEAEAHAAGVEVTIGRFPLAALGRAVIGGLMVATCYTLLFVPVAYSVLQRVAPKPDSDQEA